MPSIKYLTDQNDEVFYPVVHERGVRDSDGVALNTKLSNTTAMVTNMGSVVSVLNSEVEALTTRSSIISWDGESTPDVTAIPAGVVVSYDGTDYTGTLTASASTVGAEYLVGAENSTSKTRYITVDNNGTYTWINYGSTDLDLSDYQLKSDEVWLTEDEFAALPVKDPTKTYNVYEEVAEL